MMPAADPRLTAKSLAALMGCTVVRLVAKAKAHIGKQRFFCGILEAA